MSACTKPQRLLLARETECYGHAFLPSASSGPEHKFYGFRLAEQFGLEHVVADCGDVSGHSRRILFALRQSAEFCTG